VPPVGSHSSQNAQRGDSPVLASRSPSPENPAPAVEAPVPLTRMLHDPLRTLVVDQDVIIPGGRGAQTRT
jgi:hypothetical protein